jgi:hypothetical protein
VTNIFYRPISSYKSFVSLRFIVVITRFKVSTVTYCPVLTRCVIISYIVGHERASSLLFQCIVSILWILTILWCRHVKCSILEKEGSLQLTICAALVSRNPDILWRSREVGNKLFGLMISSLMASEGSWTEGSEVTETDSRWSDYPCEMEWTSKSNTGLQCKQIYSNGNPFPVVILLAQGRKPPKHKQITLLSLSGNWWHLLFQTRNAVVQVRTERRKWENINEDDKNEKRWEEEK